MFDHPLTDEQLDRLQNFFGVNVLETVEKVLMCKEKGKGAMAVVDDIVRATAQALEVNKE